MRIFFLVLPSLRFDSDDSFYRACFGALSLFQSTAIQKLVLAFKVDDATSGTESVTPLHAFMRELKSKGFIKVSEAICAR